MAASYSGLLAALSKNASCTKNSSRQDDPVSFSNVDNTTASDKTPANQTGSSGRVSKTRSNSKKSRATSGNKSEEDQEKDEDQIARGLSLTVATLLKLKRTVAAKNSSENSELTVSKVEHVDVSKDVKAKTKRTRKKGRTNSTPTTLPASPHITTCDVSFHQEQNNFSNGSGAEGIILFPLPGFPSFSLVSNSFVANQGSDLDQQPSSVISMRALHDPENTISNPDSASASSSVATDPPAADCLVSNLKKDVEKGMYPYDLSCAICGMLDKPLGQFLIHSKKGRNKCLSEAIERCLGVRVTRGIICSRCVTLVERCDEIIANLTPLCIKNCYRASGKVINSIKLDQDVYNQWCQLGNTQNLYADNEIAAFLLRQYETLTQGARCSTCNVPVKLTRVICSSCKEKAYAEQAKTRFSSSNSSTSRGVWAAPSTQDKQAAGKHALSPSRLYGGEDTNPIKEEEPSVYFEDSAGVPAAASHEIDDTEDLASNQDDCDYRKESKIEHLVDHDYVMLPAKGIDSLAGNFTEHKDSTAAVKLSIIPERLINGKKFLILPKDIPLNNMMLVKADIRMEAGKHVEESTVQVVFSKINEATGKKKKRPEVKLHACEVCGASFLDVTAMQTHAKSHKLGGPYMCRFCHLSFDCAENQDEHEEIHKRLYMCKKFVCHLCERTFKGEANLVSHVEAHARRESQKHFACSVCDKVYTRLQTLNDHMNKHEGEKRMYQCDQCGAAFKWRGNLFKHLIIHDEKKNPERKYICEICGKGFMRPKMLDLHIKCAHKGECPFFCHLCGKGLSSGLGYKSHLEMVHKQKNFIGEPVVCETCGEAFSSKSILAVHRRNHMLRPPCECKVCGKTLSGAHNLRMHMKCHTGQPAVDGQDKSQRFVCDVCNKPFVRWISFKKHVRIHDPNARKHVHVHDPRAQKHVRNKPYSCQTCGKILSSQSSLREHVFIHMAMRPRHTCVMCNKSFAHKGTLRQHMLLGHNPGCKPHQCIVCQAAYRTRFGLTLHKKRLGHGVVRSRSGSQAKPIQETVSSVVTDPTPPADANVSGGDSKSKPIQETVSSVVTTEETVS